MSRICNVRSNIELNEKRLGALLTGEGGRASGRRAPSRTSPRLADGVRRDGSTHPLERRAELRSPRGPRNASSVPDDRGWSVAGRARLFPPPRENAHASAQKRPDMSGHKRTTTRFGSRGDRARFVNSVSAHLGRKRATHDDSRNFRLPDLDVETVANVEPARASELNAGGARFAVARHLFRGPFALRSRRYVSRLPLTVRHAYRWARTPKLSCV